eukprot:COSAG01_NODE_2319_length_7913_cov_82.271052_8_plen_110_part_00
MSSHLLVASSHTVRIPSFACTVSLSRAGAGISWCVSDSCAQQRALATKMELFALAEWTFDVEMDCGECYHFPAGWEELVGYNVDDAGRKQWLTKCMEPCMLVVERSSIG